MNVKELIEKLQKYDPELDVVIHPFLDHDDVDYGIFHAEDVLNDNIADITAVVIEAQSTLSSFEDEGEESLCMSTIYEYADFDDPISTKRVLVLSSPDFKYGVSKEEEIV